MAEPGTLALKLDNDAILVLNQSSTAGNGEADGKTDATGDAMLSGQEQDNADTGRRASRPNRGARPSSGTAQGVSLLSD